MDGWAKFPYIRWKDGAGVECIPLLTVLVTINGETIPLDGIVDSGAQDCVVHQSLASTFQVDLSSCKKIRMAGVGGKGIDGFETVAKIQIEEMDNYEFETPIIFADIPAQLLLGQNNFFKNFQILFEMDKAQFRLKKIPRLKYN